MPIASQLREIREATPVVTRVTSFDYYATGLLKTVTNALNEPPTTYVYDDGGRVKEIWEPDGKGTKYFYYPTTGLLEQVLNRVDRPTRYEYDDAGNTKAVIDPMGLRTTFDYDALNRLHLAAAPNSPLTRYEYYPTGQLKELWTPSQRPTFYTYDGRGLLTSETDAFQRAMHYEYDPVGRLKKVTDRQQSDPYAPDTQGYNLYAYVANNPMNFVDPSGYSLEEPVFNPDAAALSLIYAMGGGLVQIYRCALDEHCRGLKDAIAELGSQGANFVRWTAESLQQAFSTYPHVNRPVSPATLVLSLALSNTPVFGDLYDLYTGVSGYDPITGQHLAGWERLANIAGALPIFGISGANIRHGMQSAEFFVGQGDEISRFIGAAGKTCSFEEDTPVATEEGAVPIREVDIGDHVLAWNEDLGETGYYTVTDAYTDVHQVLVYLTINGEAITTTPEHPFATTDGEWTPAGELEVGSEIRSADGTTGHVEAVKFAATPQVMYNMTVADAHSYTVGDGQWVV